MKRIQILTLALFTFLGFNSCTEDDEKFVITAAGASKAVLQLPTDGTDIVLDIANPQNSATTLVWDAARYEIPTEISYTVQLANSGTEFSNAVDASVTDNTYLTWTNKELNDVALGSLALTPFTAGDVDIRIKAQPGSTEAEASFSESITISITPYTTENPKAYIVGNFLGASGYGSDWTPADAVAIEASGFGETDFEGYVYMNVTSPEFKILPTNTSFDGDYGDDGTFSGVLVQEGESNILLANSGYYWIKANTDPDELTYSAQETRWAITGSATPAGWPSGTVDDQDMSYNATTKKWEITIDLTANPR
ncbi:SusE domain-containing protein [Lacinutrix neustonica]|uniref:SusE domain-containing protein n=1 Tax=Lacinutrix neustonica TaxID=2980107 RepID=A0A9E8MW36_9FLAO|nr:SusE domain-containing protein [Lacinutrix neustonica]WAC01365.1 SusE domain-containing protein [Lacinutrix neustonica]